MQIIPNGFNRYYTTYPTVDPYKDLQGNTVVPTEKYMAAKAPRPDQPGEATIPPKKKQKHGNPIANADSSSLTSCTCREVTRCAAMESIPIPIPCDGESRNPGTSSSSILNAVQSDVDIPLARKDCEGDVEMVLHYNNESIKVCVLLDTGAKTDNYISSRIADQLNLTLDTTHLSTVCSPLDTVPCVSSDGKVQLSLSYHNELTGTRDAIRIWFTVVKLTANEVIIGKPTVLAENLIAKMHNQLGGPTLEVEEGALGLANLGYLNPNPLLMNPSSRMCTFLDSTEYDRPRPLVTVQKEMYFDLHDTDELYEIEEILDEYDLNQDMEDCTIAEPSEERMPTDIRGSPSLRMRITALIAPLLNHLGSAWLLISEDRPL